MNENEKNLSGYGFSFKDYIKILENPDKIGLNNGIWSAPILKGYDKNQRGYGIDINTNKKAKALTNNRPGRWLTEKEADTLMDDHINYITETANKHIKGFSELPFRRRWALLGMLYRGDSVNKSGININEPDDLKFFKSISDYYRSKGLNTRANNSDEFFNRPVSKLLSMFKLKQGGQIRKMLTAAGGPLMLPGKSQKEVNEINNYNRNKAKGLFKGIISGKILPTMNNIGSMLGAVYNGWVDPETTAITGDVPNPGTRSPKLITQTIQKAKSIAERAAKISNKIFDRQYLKTINSGDIKRILAIRDLHFKAKTGINNPYIFQHATDNKFNSFDVNRTGQNFVEELSNRNGKGIYLTLNMSLFTPEEVSKFPDVYGDIVMPLKVWFRNPEKTRRSYHILSSPNYDGYIYLGRDLVGEAFIKNPKLIKSAYAITYDNNGNIIPISQRDNFLINDIRYKQGGKMNILEFLKNGSGIHIKEKNKGKFTSYCGGKVTDECIRRAKASGNPTLVKRATFALNARRWKHKDGGKAFINGVNVLDSNPKAYKYVKKKYRMALLGTKLNFFQKAGNWLNNNGDLVKSIANAGLGIVSNILLNKAIDSQIEANKKLMEVNKQKAFMENYKKALGLQTDRSDIINMNRAWLMANNLDYSDNEELMEENALLEGSRNNGLLDSLGGLASSILNNPNLLKKSNTGIYNLNTDIGNTTYNWKTNTFNNKNKVGTINSNGSMNTGIGGTTYNWNTNTFGSNNIMNSFDKIKF